MNKTKIVNIEDIKKFIDTLAEKMKVEKIQPIDISIETFIDNEQTLQKLKKCSCTSSGENLSYDLIDIGIIYKDSSNIEHKNIYFDFEFFDNEKIILEFSIEKDSQRIPLYRKLV